MDSTVAATNTAADSADSVSLLSASQSVAAARSETSVLPASAQQPFYPTLHKDFYLAHPHLQKADFHWGDLEASHPDLSKRSAADVEEYRKSQGISVDLRHGRRVPKPFQGFAETSFPTFVEDIAKELFTESATPFPVQAQLWPCALAGMDIIAVAPTGSGKTLAFLLPSIVHMMAQPHLDRYEGPITLVMAPTREIVQQTLSVARTFLSRTSGNDRLRAGCIFGGVSASIQVPRRGEPDYGRWPELLVATPGRLLDLFRRQAIYPSRVSYFVLDEADMMLNPTGPWLVQIRKILEQVRPDRQIIMVSATWPKTADEEARRILEKQDSEKILIRVVPEVPPIPQSIRLLRNGAETEAARRAALLEFTRNELQPHESLLIFCSNPRTVQELGKCSELCSAVQPFEESTSPASSQVVMLDGKDSRDRADRYFEFVWRQARVLVTSFQVGSRGLDYVDSKGNEVPICVVVLLFDFPPTIKDYIHCIGRTHRPGQSNAGRAVAFLPEMRFWIAAELATLLEECEQAVPPELQELIQKSDGFLGVCKSVMGCLRDSKLPVDLDACLSQGEYDELRGLWTLPRTLVSYQRKLLHMMADEFDLPHVSTGDPASEKGRQLHVARSREALPDKFFVEGEEVVVSRGGQWKGVVIDPKIKPQRRDIEVEYPGGRRSRECVDHVALAQGFEADTQASDLQSLR
eukprot:TRINITY_DN65604_c0_g1_i1.p1 TRINITY_DN65604_c0_g1~~TRINITY_DN65604_c0_g1_i1.p1  ORF type:complete len:715 (+),score=91.09 TRINITY_DN65604_c0_g1_i1:71-2146(+)